MNGPSQITIVPYTKDRIPDVIQFEKDLRKEEDFWGWEIDDAYLAAVQKSFEVRLLKILFLCWRTSMEKRSGGSTLR